MKHSALSEKDQDTFTTALWALDHPKATAVMWANGMIKGYLADLPTFQAYCDLTSIGPANDWNGQRSAANRLKVRIDLEILPLAQQMKADRLTRIHFVV